MMNELKQPITPKRALLGALLLIVFVFVVLFIKSMMFSGMHSFGVSATTVSAPSAYMNSGSFTKGMALRMQGSGGDMQVAEDSLMVGYAPEVSSPPSIAGGVPVPTSPAAPPYGDSKIVKSGYLSLLVKDTETAAGEINDIRTSLGGQPGNASVSEYSPGVKSGTIVIWVPSDKFDQAMGEIKKLALTVENDTTNVQDVSAQFVDISSRLKNLHAEEAAYLDIMKRSGKMSDVLEVTRALSDTRSQIEQLQGQLDYLSHQIALSSITVTLRQEAVPGAVTSEWRPLSVIKAAAKQALGDLTGFADMLLIMLVRLPLLLLYLAWYFFIFWVLYRAARFLYGYLRRSAIFGPPKQ